MSHQPIPSVIEDISAMYRTNYIGFASFSMLIWDHVDTFQTEVEYIWKRPKGLLVYLFLINRYLTPLGFVVNLYAYLSPVWTTEMCNHFIRFEGSMTVIGINIVAMMMFLRVRALYKQQNIVLGIVAFLLLFQVCMNGWLLTRGEAVVHNEKSGVLACTMIFDPQISVLASSSAWLPLLYDTVVLVLIAYRTFPSFKFTNRHSTVKRLLEDGLLYYTAIFAVNAVLTIMIIAAPPGLKNITAQLELLLTVTMMSRITLNLRKSVGRIHEIQAEMPRMFMRGRLSVDSGIKTVTPAFKSQRDRANSKSSGGEFAMINFTPPSPGKWNDWANGGILEESDSWDERATISSRVDELRTIGGTLRFANGEWKGAHGR